MQMDGEESSNIEDRRGEDSYASGGFGGGGLGGIPMGSGGGGGLFKGGFGVIAFIVIALWAWSPKQKSRFEEAANLPFVDDNNDQPEARS